MNVFWRQKKKTNQRLKQQSEKKPVVNLRVAGFVSMGVAVTVALVMGWLKLMDPQTLPLRQVKLEAPFIKVQKHDLYEAVKARVNGGFFNVDVAAITESVSMLPWVDEVKVRRVWPDTVHVTVLEQKALARWQNKALVNVRGELFYPAVESFPDGLVDLQGPQTSVDMMAGAFHEISTLLQPLNVGIKNIKLTPRLAWEVVLVNGVVVVLGRKEMPQRLQRFVRFYPHLARNEANVKRVDMRYTNGFAVKWHKLPLA